MVSDKPDNKELKEKYDKSCEEINRLKCNEDLLNNELQKYKQFAEKFNEWFESSFDGDLERKDWMDWNYQGSNRDLFVDIKELKHLSEGLN